MKEIYCSNCGTKLVEGGRFCAKCGASVQQPPAGPAAEKPPSPYGQCYVQQSPYAAPPPKKRFASKIALIASACVFAAGTLVFGVYMLFIKPTASHSLEAADFRKSNPAATIAPKHSPLTKHSSGSSGNFPGPLKTMYSPGSPQNTPEPIETPAADTAPIEYSWIIGYNDVPGITEDEAYDYFGDPQYRDTIDAPDGMEIYLNYGSYILKFFSYDGETSGTCYEVQITSTPCPLGVYGLEIGMDSSDIEYALAGSPFELTYQDPDGTYCVYSDASTGHDLFINLADGAVWDYAVFYSP